MPVYYSNGTWAAPGLAEGPFQGEFTPNDGHVVPKIEDESTGGDRRLRLEPDSQNVVASRLEGEWVLDHTLNARLEGFTDGIDALTFTNDADIATRVSPQDAEWLGHPRVFMAGTFGPPRKRTPFILISKSGNPFIVRFDDDMNMTGGSSLMLAPAEKPENDILLLGTDFNNEPFRAMRRKRP